MPALEQSELEQMYQAVAGFTEDALRYAIEQAKDPEKAEQLAERLEQDLAAGNPREPFAAMALMVVLGEVKVEAAIPILLTAAMNAEPSRHLHQEAATYALQRMGDPALLATMAQIENATDPGERVQGYWILHAAMDAGEATRRAVQDFCLSRARTESPSQGEDDWDPRSAALAASVALGDARVRPLLQDLAAQAEPGEEADQINELLKELESGERWPYEADWRTDWPEQCQIWGELLEDVRQQDAADAKTEELRAVNAEVAEGYRQSLLEGGIPQNTAQTLTETVEEWLNFAAQYGLDVRELRLDLLREVLLDYTPAEMLGDPAYFKGLAGALEDFFLYLHQSGRLENLKPFEKAAQEAERVLPGRSTDRNRWSFQKLLYMTGEESGYDMDSTEGAAAFLQELVDSVGLENAQPREQAQGQAAAGEELVEQPTNPFERAEMKVGRNDPCPCGSGKKYKKCCGR